MAYRLKSGVESFEVVDGEFAGKRFLKGKTYDKIPTSEKCKFEKIKTDEGRGATDEKSKADLPSSERSDLPSSIENTGGDK